MGDHIVAAIEHALDNVDFTQGRRLQSGESISQPIRSVHVEKNNDAAQANSDTFQVTMGGFGPLLQRISSVIRTFDFLKSVADKLRADGRTSVLRASNTYSPVRVEGQGWDIGPDGKPISITDGTFPYNPVIEYAQFNAGDGSRKSDHRRRGCPGMGDLPHHPCLLPYLDADPLLLLRTYQVRPRQGGDLVALHVFPLQPDPSAPVQTTRGTRANSQAAGHRRALLSVAQHPRREQTLKPNRGLSDQNTTVAPAYHTIWRACRSQAVRGGMHCRHRYMFGIVFISVCM